jgi:hypothetical protein
MDAATVLAAATRPPVTDLVTKLRRELAFGDALICRPDAVDSTHTNVHSEIEEANLVMMLIENDGQ